ncbi:uncharacterized protein LOC123551961 [Mercenaria mercenaria]|uniref:uncharacterized protein LOC123551961 n=1 Tax=Mercenaria mercenaria TaxID=6596 RepID=UPI00234E9E31|nr:uncharacterized protein LOC123551961 [Mercenaria mercenaria]XP_053396418.1 uncharacterized protein LOC123551961 [Mercenaria mercenaria]
MKKWKDLKSQTKKKEQIRRKEMGKTGGGGAVNSLRDWEEKIISVIPSAVIDGLNDGQDIKFKKNAEGVGETCVQPSTSETVVQVEGEETVVIHPSTIHVQVESRKEVVDEVRDSKKRKRSLTELEKAQLNFYEEITALCRSQRKVAEQQVKTLAVQEEFFKLATKTLAEKNDLSGILDLFTEQ